MNIVDEGKELLMNIDEKLQENFKCMGELEFYINNGKNKTMIEEAKKLLSEFEKYTKILIEKKYEIIDDLSIVYTKTLLDFNNKDDE